MLKCATVCVAALLAVSSAQEGDTMVEAAPTTTGQVPPAAATQPARKLPEEALREMGLTPPLPGEEADQHVVSQTRMFSVSGGDSLRMGAIATKADEIRGAVCHLLGIETTWKYGISIRLIGKSTDAPEPNPIRTRISIIGAEPNFQIRIYPGGGIDVERLTNAIITMTLFERALCEQRIDALPESVSIPHWLITGVQQAVLWRSGKADRRLYRSLFDRGEMLAPEDIISTENPHKLDATSRQVYEASCGVLIQALVNREGGPAQLRELISESAMAEGSVREIVSAHFHELGVDANMLTKWWALELAALSEAPATEMLTPMESEKQLTEALTLLWYDPETLTPHPISADNAYALLDLPDWRNKLKPCIEQLMQLNIRCFPGYRSIILEYCRAFNELLQGATPDEVQEILLPLSELRQAYITTSLRARDYLDWYEITHLGESSHKEGFTAYLETMSLLRREKPGPDTHMSRYLRDIEELYTLPSGRPLPEDMMRAVRAARNTAKTHKAEP